MSWGVRQDVKHCRTPGVTVGIALRRGGTIYDADDDPSDR
jgi:hypothetical protein